MTRWIRRGALVGLLGGGGWAGYSAWRRHQQPVTPSTPPSWPPLDPEDATSNGAAVIRGFTDLPVEPTATADAGRRWVTPVGGGCPDGYPVKANDNSGIFHVPGGRFYERTVPERCYADSSDAEADGYRPAKA